MGQPNIVLLAADGAGNDAIAAELGTNRLLVASGETALPNAGWPGLKMMLCAEDASLRLGTQWPRKSSN